MQGKSSLKSAYQEAINQLPWQTHQVSLLLDGINTPDIIPFIYNGKLTKKFELLYVNTRFSPLNDVSPCLIELSTPNSYPISRFIDNLSSEWGYILTSQMNFDKQVNHLRKLLVVENAMKQKLLLKIADPLVMPALLSHAIDNNQMALLGPFDQVLSYDVIEKQIINLYRPSHSEIVCLPEQTYQLDVQEEKILDQIDIKRANQKIYDHMQTYFPEFIAQQADAALTINYLIDQAESKGYSSIQEQLYYLNIFGYLGFDALEHPQITSLIAKKNSQSLKEAAFIAEQLAQGALL